MIKDGVVNVLGALIDNVVPGEAEPCPKCNGTDLEIIRDIEMQPQGFRVKCSKCGASVPQGAKFCPECGQPMNVVCPKCGASLDEKKPSAKKVAKKAAKKKAEKSEDKKD